MAKANKFIMPDGSEIAIAGAEGGGDSYTLPIMSDTQLGGGKAVSKTDEDVPVAVDPETGQLFVPTYPVQGGITEEQKQQLKQNTQDITDLKSALNGISLGVYDDKVYILLLGEPVGEGLDVS